MRRFENKAASSNSQSAHLQIGTMTFEEFFKKKKINLVSFSQADGGLFAEFKTHYEAMGEKSFDHTKKYWFNKLRRLYPAPPEIKSEKIVIENQLAEQTITETLTEPARAAPPIKAGFTPRFKAGTTLAKPTESGTSSENTPAGEVPAQPKAGFKPKFKPPEA